MKKLWRVPVLCLVGSWVAFYLTVYLGRFFFVVKTVGENGNMIVSADPVRSSIFHWVLFLLILVVGGILFLRSMTKKEIALSAAIISGIYLIFVLLQLYLPSFPLGVSVILAQFQNWTWTVSNTLYQITGNLTLSTIAACFSPFLYLFFGKSKA